MTLKPKHSCAAVINTLCKTPFQRQNREIELPHLHVENSSSLYFCSEGVSWSDDPISNRSFLPCKKHGNFYLFFFFRFRCCLCSCTKCFLKQISERERNTNFLAALNAEQKQLILLLKWEHF